MPGVFVVVVAIVAFVALLLLGATAVITLAVLARGKRRQVQQEPSGARKPGSHGIDLIIAAQAAGIQGAGRLLEDGLGRQEAVDVVGKVSRAMSGLSPVDSPRPN